MNNDLIIIDNIATLTINDNQSSFKRCKQCRVLKPKHAFNTQKGYADGLHTTCRDCRSICERERNRVLGSREHIAIPEQKKCCHCLHILPSREFVYDQTRKSGLYSMCRTCAKEVIQTRKENDPVRHRMFYMAASAKQRAKKDNLSYNIDKYWLLEEFGHLTHCPVLGIEFNWLKEGGGGAYNSPTMDRLDPARGYVKGNVRIISYQANAMKRDASPGMLRQFCESELARLNTPSIQENADLCRSDQSPPSYPIAPDGKIPQNGQFIETPL